MKKIILVFIAMSFFSCATYDSSQYTYYEPAFNITDMDFANTDGSNNLLSFFGSSFDVTAVRYITPRIMYSYSGAYYTSRTLNIKIINPDGILETSSSSPNGYSYNYNLYIGPYSWNAIEILTGWGNDNGGSYEPGTYTCEVWSSGLKLGSSRFTITGSLAFSVTGIDFVNEDKDNNHIGSYGTSFDSADVRYIAPRVTYNYAGSAAVNRNLDVKIINPDGSLNRSSSSPAGYSYSDTLNVQPNRKGEKATLAGWGNNSGGAYDPGTYTCEIWSNGQKLASARFTVSAAAAFTVTAMDFINIEKGGAVIGSYGTSFDAAALRYITPRITYNYTGSAPVTMDLYIKIINPDGSLDRSSSSPSGYSYSYSMDIPLNQNGNKISFPGWGSDDGGTYDPGTYTCEVWSSGKMLYSAKFIITTAQQQLIKMTSIQGGSFIMGSADGLVGSYDDEYPSHRVTVSPFQIGIYEVTQKEYRNVMGKNPSHFTGDNLPVEKITWLDAIDFCNALSIREGLTPAYTKQGSGNNISVTWNRKANGYRLPTEAEWEYACGAGGNGIDVGAPPLSKAADLANFNGKIYTLPITENRGETTAVGTFAPNAWGLYDMQGNVWEWCWDRYGPYDGTEQTDPTGPDSGDTRVLKGGSFETDARMLRPAQRIDLDPLKGNETTGFRIVRR